MYFFGSWWTIEIAPGVPVPYVTFNNVIHIILMEFIATGIQPRNQNGLPDQYASVSDSIFSEPCATAMICYLKYNHEWVQHSIGF